MTQDRRHRMRSLLSPRALALAFGAATAASAQSSGKLNVSVAGVRNDNGSVRCGLYSSANGFREPGREMRGAVAPIKNGQATCVPGLVPGHDDYGRAVTENQERWDAQLAFPLCPRVACFRRRDRGERRLATKHPTLVQVWIA